MIRRTAVPPLRRAAFRRGGVLLYVVAGFLGYIVASAAWEILSRAGAYFQTLGVPVR